MGAFSASTVLADDKPSLYAERNDSGVKLTAKWTIAAEHAILAVYDANGRMLGVTVADGKAQSCTTEISCDPDQAKSTALFLTDLNYRPAAAAVREEVNEAPVPVTLTLTIGESDIDVSWEENESVTALRNLVADKSLTIQMSMYGGFEQVGSLGTNLPRNDVRITTEPGDIVLYSGNQLVMFYGSNTWAYTRLGRIAGLSEQELRALLSNGNVELTLSMK